MAYVSLPALGELYNRCCGASKMCSSAPSWNEFISAVSDWRPLVEPYIFGKFVNVEWNHS